MKPAAAVVTVAAAAMLLVGCVQTPSSPGTEAAALGTGFREFVEGYFDSYFNFHPTEATAAGIHLYAVRLEPWSASRIQNRVFDLKRQQSSAEAILKQKLSTDEAIDAGILLNRIRREMLDIESIRWWRRNPLMYVAIPGAAIDGIMKRDYAPAKERLKAVIARMKLIPGFLDAMRNNTTEVPTEFAELSVRVIRGSIPFFRDTLPEWARTAAGGDGVLMPILRPRTVT